MNKAAFGSMLVRINAFAPCRFFNRSKLPVLMYHRFSEREEFGRTSRSTFRRQLRYVTRHYKVISMTEAAACIREGKSFPPRSAVITIDDGYRDFYDVAFPVLKDFAVPATIYLVTEFVSGKCWIWTDKARTILDQTAARELDVWIGGKHVRAKLGDAGSRLRASAAINSELKKLGEEEKEVYLAGLSSELNVPIQDFPTDKYAPITWDQAKQIAAAGIEIGSHTRTHPILTNIEDKRLETELQGSRSEIQNHIQSHDVHFCYPNGDVGSRERKATQAVGYASAVTTEIRFCESSSDRFLIPRIDAEPEMYRFVQATSGFDRLKGRGPERSV